MDESRTHTPGPWTVRPAGYVCGALNDPDWIADIICEQPKGRDSPSRKYWAANARLIAAAPDMLEALRNIITNAHTQPDVSMNGATDTCAVTLDDMDAALRAVEKATGLTP